ncbi:hypothetical protein HX001_00945 [Empedobacter brevis]|nr:hypothetical protein [Empedobacter brevis]MDM1071054.1 hypothetical protein [Empedobacter brevis]QES93423.1 hypothetical protein F0358_12215 [Empedobacter brevis]QHC85243.1 hypothetical protein AS589_10875 [Empedobacter brevis]
MQEKMKLLIAIGCLTLSLGFVLLCSFLNLEIFFNQLLGVVFLFCSLLTGYLGFNYLFDYLNYTRLINKGVKVKAHIIEIKRSLLGENHLPDYIIEVFYKHPNNEKIYYTEFEYFGDINANKILQKGKDVDILIDPQNPENIYFKNVI